MLQSGTGRSSNSAIRTTIACATAAVLALAVSPRASAQWATFVDDTANRIQGGPLEGGMTIIADNQEKDFAWADLDQDGDIDLVCVRKFPFTNPGGKRNILFMNENGVLVDRTSTKANTSLGVVGFTSNGMLDETNDRDVVIADFNNDGWLDVATATTISDGLPRYISHPRIYMNMGESGGVWQGLRYEYDRFPQLFSVVNGTPQAPRFCSVAAGDVTGDGFADLYFGDYDGGFDSTEPPNNDVDNKLMVNNGSGFFADGTGLSRFPSNFTYPTVGSQTFNWAKFGAASVIADMNGDGKNDIVKQTSLQAPVHVGVMTNNAANVGVFSNYKIIYSGAAYFVSEGDLNNDGRLDLVMSDDGADRYLLNTGNDGTGAPNFTSLTFTSGEGSNFDDGFASQNIIVDLDNDGFKDVLISDVDVDEITSACDARRLHIYRNLGNTPNVTLHESWPTIINATDLKGVHNVAVFDINNDGWKDMVLGRCYSTRVWMNTGTKLTVPTAPAFVNPSTGTPFQVTIDSSAIAPIVNGSARLYYSVNGAAFAFAALTPAGGTQYTALLPAGICGDEIRYYISVQTNVNGNISTYTNPVGAPAAFYTALRGTSQTITLDQTYEGRVPEWTVSNDAGLIDGAWQAVDPIGTLNGGQQAQPEDDATVAGVKAFVTKNGVVSGAATAADVDGGATNLLSPTIDATTGEYRISYAYWFYTNTGTPGTDTLTVSVSNNNGSSWTTVKTYTARSFGWIRDSFRIGNFVTPTAQVRVRFAANDGSTDSIVEAGIDDFRIEKIGCAPACYADIDDNTTVDTDDLLALLGGWGTCTNCPATACGSDIAPPGVGNCTVDTDDLLLLLGSWGACPQ